MFSNPRIMMQFQAVKEILLAGDTNRLVAELTFVRINDLAAPPERLDVLAYLEPVVICLILCNGIMSLEALRSCYLKASRSGAP